MGMYTGLKLDCTLHDDVPEIVISILDYMLDDEKARPELPNHPLFTSECWSWMFHGTSAYLEPEYRPDSYRDGKRLHVSFNIKNSDGEIDKFLQWISPYVASVEEGLYKYEQMRGDVPVMLNDGLLSVDMNHPNSAVIYV